MSARPRAQAPLMVVAPGSTQTSSLRARRGLVGSLSWRLILDADGSAVIADSTDAITAVDIGEYYMLRYDRPWVAPDDEGVYRAIWSRGTDESVEVVVVASEYAALATADDVAARLGLASAAGLSSEQSAAVAFLLPMAATVIADAAGRDDGWVIALDPIPQLLRSLSVELVVRALANPSGVESYREQIGQYSISQTFGTGRVGMALSDAEALMVSRAVYGRTTSSTRARSVFGEAERLLRGDQR